VLKVPARPAPASEQLGKVCPPGGFASPRAGEGGIPFRVQIGVTGHRMLDDPVAVTHRVGASVRAICRMFPSTSVTPIAFTILSSLAEGADRLVVRCALDLLSHAEVVLEAVLPLSVPDYTRDFDSMESRDEFEDLLAIAAVRTPMPVATSRDDAYARAGRYIVERSDVMIAVWDGRRSQGRGGTAEIVTYARERGVPVFVARAQRGGEAVAEAEITTIAESLPMKSSREAFARVEEYNRQSFGDQRLDRQYARERAGFDDAIKESSLQLQCAAAMSWALPYFIRADALAVKYQRRYNALGLALYGLAALAVTAVAGQSVFASTQPSWAMVEVGLLTVLLVVVTIARRGGVHDRWFGYRSMAEAFRSSPFIALVGGSDLRDADGRPAPAGGEQPWFQRAFSEAWASHPLFTVDERYAVALERLLISGWIERQITYHRRTVERFRRERNRLTHAVFALFGATIIVGLLHILEVGGSSARQIFVFLAIMLPGFGAALTGIRDQRQYRLHEKRSRRTADRLEGVRGQMALGTPSLAGARKLASETQTVVENETLDWSGVAEFQDLELIM
jgi:hypothetical protein